jgi:hypothetical protein
MFLGKNVRKELCPLNPTVKLPIINCPLNPPKGGL